MNLFNWQRVSLLCACLLLKPTESTGQAIHQLPSLGGMVMTANDKTLVVSVPTTGQLLYFDALTAKESKKMEVDFQPGALAVQGNRLFVATKGAPIIHVLDADTGKEQKQIKLPGLPIDQLACHPVKGLLYAINDDMDVFSIDPASSKATLTKAVGQKIVVDPSDGNNVYTSIFKPARNRLLVQEMPGRTLKVQLIKGKASNILLKFKADGADLKFAAGNPNAGSGGSWFGVSRDGKRVAMSGPYRVPGKGLTFNIAVFDTADMSSILGQLPMSSFPRAICFHPYLDLVATVEETSGISVFNAKSFVKKESFKLPRLTVLPYTLTFGGQGAKLISASPVLGTGGREKTLALQFHSLSLSEQQKDELRKVFSR
jgi:hypothetical protein